MDRRRFLGLGAAGAVAAFLAACGSDNSGSTAGATTTGGAATTTAGAARATTAAAAGDKLGGGGGDGTIKVGYVSPKTGPLAAFAEADDFIFSGIKDATKDGVRSATRATSWRSSPRTARATRTGPARWRRL